MKRFLKRLLCKHKYRLVGEWDIVWYSGKCDKCGKEKFYRRCPDVPYVPNYKEYKGRSVGIGVGPGYP